MPAFSVPKLGASGAAHDALDPPDVVVGAGYRRKARTSGRPKAPAGRGNASSSSRPSSIGSGAAGWRRRRPSSGGSATNRPGSPHQPTMTPQPPRTARPSSAKARRSNTPRRGGGGGGDEWAPIPVDKLPLGRNAWPAEKTWGTVVDTVQIATHQPFRGTRTRHIVIVPTGIPNAPDTFPWPDDEADGQGELAEGTPGFADPGRCVDRIGVYWTPGATQLRLVHPPPAPADPTLQHIQVPAAAPPRMTALSTRGKST